MLDVKFRKRLSIFGPLTVFQGGLWASKQVHDYMEVHAHLFFPFPPHLMSDHRCCSLYKYNTPLILCLYVDFLCKLFLGYLEPSWYFQASTGKGEVASTAWLFQDTGVLTQHVRTIGCGDAFFRGPECKPQSLPLQCNYCVTVGRFLNICKAQFPHLNHGRRIGWWQC